MDKMIRIDMPQKGSAAPLWIGAGLALVILVGAIALIWVARDSLDNDGFILLTGIAIISLLALMTFFVMSRTHRVTEQKQVRQETVYSGAFYNNIIPSLVITDGKPVRANQAYLDLAKELGAESLGDAPPVIDRLFTSGGNEAAAAIFRLHHLAADMDLAEETLDVISPKNGLKRFKIQVSRINRRSMLWQVMTGIPDRSVAQDVLAEAPVGLFTVAKDGSILASNDVLLRWLGGTDNLQPETLASFIENPKALLDSPSEPGRTVRADTRLITRKGVVTPTVMVANWHTLNSGDIVASVALYGHSTILLHLLPY